MEALLTPAIHLMNKLIFGQKFSLISALFSAARLSTSGIRVLQSYEQLSTTQTERGSLEVLGNSLDIRRDLIRAYAHARR